MGKDFGRPFILKDERGLRALPGWLEFRKVNAFSTASLERISVGIRTNRPGAPDWQHTKVGQIVVCLPELHAPALEVIRKTIWPDGDPK